MKRAALDRKATEYLQALCESIQSRRLGSEGNRQATAYVSQVLEKLGFDVSSQTFDCLDWENRGATLIAGREIFDVMSSPYTLGCDIRAPLAVATSVDELGGLVLEGKIVLLKGELTREQLMPKKFSFYNPEHHQALYALLEAKSPSAIICATSRNPELAGGMYPFPMIEDGDFDIPSVYMRDVDGEKLARRVDELVSLQIEANRIPAMGENVLARIGPPGADRIVLCAHIDAKEDTPGALDNASGVAMLLILAELLKTYTGGFQIEILMFNGEDHYSAQGQKVYILSNQGGFDDIRLAINTDVAGYIHGRSAYSLYGCEDSVATKIHGVMEDYESLLAGPQWYQSDHSIFIQQGRPAMAITSDQFLELSTRVTHTSRDRIELVDIRKMIDIACALRDVITALA